MQCRSRIWKSTLLLHDCKTPKHLPRNSASIPNDRYTARVELSIKVVDGLPKLKRTLCHELCHVAAWLLDHCARPPHGDVWRGWADRAQRAYPELEITTCHSYDIFFPHRWQCTNAECADDCGGGGHGAE